MLASVKPPESLVIVGNGMAGYKFCEKLVETGAHHRFRIKVFAEEPLPAYDRIHLTDIISNRTTEHLLLTSHEWYLDHGIELFLDEPIKTIDRDWRTVVSANGVRANYDRLILATGSRAHVPAIDGAAENGVMVYRTFDDLEKIIEFSLKSRRAIVIGGGLLGLEAAKALRDMDMEVHLIHNHAWLMNRQLDAVGSEYLRRDISRFGIHVHLNARTTRIEDLGSERVVHLDDKRVLRGDMVILATGIHPRSELAAKCGLGLAPNGGIIVNDQLQTSDPAVYAIGECASFALNHFGFLAPNFQMANVLAMRLAGIQDVFSVPNFSIKLKPMGIEVATLGEPLRADPGVKEVVYQSESIYRKIVLTNSKISGAIVVGDTPEFSRIQEAATAGQKISLWERLRFQRDGHLWREETIKPVAEWPAEALVCNCMGITRGTLAKAQLDGCTTVQALCQRTGAGTVCGSCKPLLAQITGSEVNVPVDQAGQKGLWAASWLALALCLALVAVPSTASRWLDERFGFLGLWSNSFTQQITGFTILGLLGATFVLSFRKRARFLQWGKFGFWRAVHALLGAGIVVGIMAHTGLSMGSNLNFALMANTLVLSAMGALAGGTISYPGRAHQAAPDRWRFWLTRIHIAALWSLPALLAIHVFAVYYF